MVAGPAGALLLSVFHEPTGRALYGTERDLASAEGWFEGARLIFAEAEGRA